MGTICYLQKEDQRIEVEALYDPIQIKIIELHGATGLEHIVVGTKLNASDIRGLYDDGWRLVGDGVKSKMSADYQDGAINQ